jgi:hypothetical protein
VINRLRFWLAGLIAPRVFYLPAGSELDMTALALGTRLIHLPPEFPPVAISEAALTTIVALYRWHCRECAHAFTNPRAYQTHDCKLYRDSPLDVLIDVSNLE